MDDYSVRQIDSAVSTYVSPTLGVPTKHGPVNHEVSYGPYDPYKSKPDGPLFTVVDTAEKTDVQVAVEWPARYVSSVDWIDDHFVLAKGEGAFLAIIDVASGRQTHSLVGYNFTVAPNNAAFVDIDARSVVPQS